MVTREVGSGLYLCGVDCSVFLQDAILRVDFDTGERCGHSVTNETALVVWLNSDLRHYQTTRKDPPLYSS